MQDCADMEAWHLKHDCIILFPVKGEAYGFGSLAEVGFVIRTEIDNTDFRFVLMFIEPAVSAELVDHCPGQADGSRRARQLVLARLSQVDSPNVLVVASMDEMLAKNITLTTLQKSRATA